MFFPSCSPVVSSASTIAGLVHQNSMNSRQQNQLNGSNGPYGGNGVHMPSPGGSSTTLPQPQGNPSPFQSPTPSSSNNPPQTLQGGLPAGTHTNSANSPNIPIQQPALSGDGDGDSRSSVQKIIQEMMMSSQLGGRGMVCNGTLGNDVKNVNGVLPTNNNAGLNGSNRLIGNGAANIHTGVGGTGFGSMSYGLGQSGTVNGMRAALENNSVGMNGRVGMAMARDQSTNQPDLGNQLLNGLGAVNGYSNFNFDWKASP